MFCWGATRKSWLAIATLQEAAKAKNTHSLIELPKKKIFSVVRMRIMPNCRLIHNDENIMNQKKFEVP